MTVQRYHFQMILLDLKKFSGHQLVVVVVRDREDRLANDFF